MNASCPQASTSHRYQRTASSAVLIGAVTANRLPYRSRVHSTGPVTSGPGCTVGSTRPEGEARSRVIVSSIASESG